MDKPQRAIGLAWDPQDGLPRIVAKGVGPYADAIGREFRRTKPAHRAIADPGLLEKLYRLPMDAEISPDLYELVAILIVHILSVEASLKGKPDA